MSSKPTAPDSAGKVVEARRVGSRAGVAPGEGEFTYVVLAEPPAEPAAKGDRRRAPRQRTRLRSGKLVTVGGEFLTECLIYDLSPRGCRIRLPAGRPLPRAIQLLDDQSGLLHRCALLWRDGSDIGVRFDVQTETQRTREQAEALRRKFYAVRN